ncbi:MAG: class I SAM-dependent methyltransferase [Chloroflexota bacterium]
MSPTTDSVRRFYDEFAGTLLRDYIRGNPRVDHQYGFLAEAVSPADQDILIIGCGLGHVGRFLAGKARAARIVACDLSGECIRLAGRLFRHPRVQYRVLDVLTDPIDGLFDFIALPDVYEHIPAASRGALHERLGRALGTSGRIAVTGPTPGHQAMLRAGGGALQPVDEDVTLEDLRTFAGAVGGALTFYRMISVWRTNDYFHALIERGAESVRELTDADKYALKGWPKEQAGCRFACRWWRRLKLAQVGLTAD